MRTYSTPPWAEAFTTGAEPFPLPLESLALPRQVHSARVARVCEPCRPEATDAVFTSTPGLWIAVKTADCIPILLCDLRRRTVAAVHAGWRGTLARILPATIEAMGSQPADLQAIICPGISCQAYEVGDELYEAFRLEGFPMGRIAAWSDKWHIDLPAANAWLLEQCGVASIHRDETCTYASPDLYSARRDPASQGRNYNCIRIKPLP